MFSDCSELLTDCPHWKPTESKTAVWVTSAFLVAGSIQSMQSVTTDNLVHFTPGCRSLMHTRERVESFLANVYLSVCRLSSVMLMHPTQALEIFGNISMALGTLAIH